MAKTGPQRYPGANVTYWYQGRYPGSAMESNVAVWHTTEGTSLPSYGGGSSAPNFTAVPDIGGRRLRWYQHFDFDVSSRALRNESGGVETNTANAVQIELVGTCDPSHRTSWSGARAGVDYLFWPDAPDWALAELGEFVRWAFEEHGLQMRSAVDWTPYPESYGGGSYRLTGSQWSAYYGHLGHQHVPENSHGDPGNLNFARVLEHARGTTTPEEDGMPLTAEEKKDIAREVWDLTFAHGGSKVKARTYLGRAYAHARDGRQEVAALSATVDKLVDTVAALSAGQEWDPEALKRDIREAIEGVTVRLETGE